MIRDVFIIIVIVCIVITGDVYAQNIFKYNSEELIEKLEMLKQNIEKGEKNNIEIANEIYENWEKISDKWSVIIEHQELDLIETAILLTKSSVETDDMETAIQQIEQSVFLLGHVKDKETLNLKNIF